MPATEQIITTVENVGTSWVVVTLPIRAKRYRVYRARATKVSGTLTSIALRVLDAPTNLEPDIALEYDLTTGYIDYEESGLLIQTTASSTFLACKADTTPNSIKVILDIEPV